MDEILASIRRIIESGDERNAPRPQSERKASTVAENPSPPSAAGSGHRPDNAVPPFDLRYVPSPPHHENGYRPADEQAGDEFFRSDLSRAARAANDLPLRGGSEPGMRSSDEEGDETSFSGSWGELRSGGGPLGVDTVPAVEAPAAAMREAEAGAIVPPAGNENAMPGSAFVQLDETPLRPAEFSFEFDDDELEAELRENAWMEGRGKVEEVSQVSEATGDAAPAKPYGAQMPESVIDGASALLSAQAGDQVAAAFDDLARAIRDGQMRSMEEMAREMMRPMLREWLDDNLPRIVERLVREEIERIARGPRR